MIGIVEGESDDEIREKATMIHSLSEDVYRFNYFNSTREFVVYGPNDLSFTDFLLFRDIKNVMGIK